MAYSYPQQAGRAGSIELYNGIGTKVAAYTLPVAAKGTMPLSLGNLQSGVYLIVLKENGQIKASSKLIIAR
ncbi:MAG: T9SS type A sorting domain-containing protein [Chitinophagales bacterium]|nr:T9SS type A sorting domain-containing protein [Chitinophagales bacterium]